MGGDCLNTGCVPSKALIRSAKLLSHIRRAQQFGLQGATARFDFADIMERVQRVVRTVEPHDSVERYTSLGVECIEGTREDHFAVDSRSRHRRRAARTLSTRSIVIAAGRTTLRAADSRHRGGRLPDLGHGLEPARAAEAPGGAGRRTDRLRTHPGLRPLRRPSHPGRDGAAHHDPRGSRGFRDWWRSASARRASPCWSATRPSSS